MRICFTLPFYDPADTDPELFFERARLMRHLPQAVAALGYKVDMVILFPTAHTFEENGVQYHFVRSSPRLQALTRRLSRRSGRNPTTLEPAFGVFRTIRRLQPDLIHFHGANLYLNHRLLLARLGRKKPPIVLHYHGGLPSRHRLAGRIQRFNFQHAARFLFTTEAHAQPFIDAGLIEEPERVVGFMETSSAFRLQPRSEARRATGMMGDPVLLWAGRLDANKDPMTALRAFEQILAARPAAHLYLHYLTHELLPDLRRFVEARPPLHGHVHFRGRVPFEAMEPIYNSADFLLQASHREFSGVAVLDAMACGVIPAVTDIPSFRAMTGAGRHGILFAPGDADALARRVLAVPPEEIAARSQQVHTWFEQTLSFPALAQQLDGIYGEVLKEG